MDAALNHHNLVVLAWVTVGLIAAVIAAIACWLMFTGPDRGEVDPQPDQPTDVLAGPAATIRAVLGDFERRVGAELAREQRIIADARARSKDATAEQPTVALPPVITRSPLAAAHPRPAPIRVKLTQPAKAEPVSLPVRHPTRLAITASSADAPTDAAAYRVVPGFAGVDALTYAAVAEHFATVELCGPVVDIAFADWGLPVDDGPDWTATGWTREGVRALRERMAASARRELVGA